MTKARRFFLVILIGLASLFQSCAHYRVVVPEPTPATDYETVTMHAYFWGASEKPQPAKNCLDNTIDEVRVRQTFPNFLATVVTLGIWMPLEVEWKCSKRQNMEGADF